MLVALSWSFEAMFCLLLYKDRWITVKYITKLLVTFCFNNDRENVMCIMQKQIEALKDLCLKAGINDADIAACAPHCKCQRPATLLYVVGYMIVSDLAY